MRIDVPDHPEIAWAMRTGYPSWNQPTYYYCEKCNDELDSDELFSDENYDILCEHCLKELHKKLVIDG